MRSVGGVSEHPSETSPRRGWRGQRPRSEWTIRRRAILTEREGHPPGDSFPGAEAGGPASAAVLVWVEAPGARYRLTWKGAVLTTWKLSWPVVAVRRALYRHRAAALVRRLDVAG